MQAFGSERCGVFHLSRRGVSFGGAGLLVWVPCGVKRWFAVGCAALCVVFAVGCGSGGYVLKSPKEMSDMLCMSFLFTYFAV